MQYERRLFGKRPALAVPVLLVAALLGAMFGCAPKPVDTQITTATSPQPTAAGAVDNTQDNAQVSVAGALDAALTGYAYPYPVQHFRTQSQGLVVEMAYMDVEPVASQPTVARPAVLLLHGKNFSGAYWKSTADALVAKGYRVIIPDQVGFGKSSKLKDFQYSFQELARLTEALLTEVGVERVAVVGHSMGGMLATRFALMYPKRTAQLVLVNPIGLEDWKRVVPYHSIDEWAAENAKETPERVC